jgi:hypothetical protein
MSLLIFFFYYISVYVWMDFKVLHYFVVGEFMWKLLI